MLARAVVRNGKVVIDEPTRLPEGTVLDLVVDDEGDELHAEDRAGLERRLDAAQSQADAGMTMSAARFVLPQRSTSGGVPVETARRRDSRKS